MEQDGTTDSTRKRHTDTVHRRWQYNIIAV